MTDETSDKMALTYLEKWKKTDFSSQKSKPKKKKKTQKPIILSVHKASVVR